MFNSLITNKFEQIVNLLQKYNINKIPTPEVLANAIIVYSDSFAEDLYNIKNDITPSFLGGIFAKKVINGLQNATSKDAPAETENKVSGYDKFKTYLNDGLGFLSQGINLFNTAKAGTVQTAGTPTDNKKNTNTYFIVGVVIVVVLIIILLNKKK